RVLNLVCIVDKQWSGEIANRLRGVGRYHASRTIVLAIQPRRERIDAVATLASEANPRPGEVALVREPVVVDIGTRHLGTPAPRPRAERPTLSAVQIRHHPDSAAAALLLVGWLASRLGWEPSALVARDGALEGTAHARRQDVRIRLEPEAGMPVRGLAGVTLQTASGRRFSLDRGPGGLRAHYVNRHGDERTWTVVGA